MERDPGKDAEDIEKVADGLRAADANALRITTALFTANAGAAVLLFNAVSSARLADPVKAYWLGLAFCVGAITALCGIAWEYLHAVLLIRLFDRWASGMRNRKGQDTEEDRNVHRILDNLRGGEEHRLRRRSLWQFVGYGVSALIFIAGVAAPLFDSAQLPRAQAPNAPVHQSAAPPPPLQSSPRKDNR